MSARAPDTDVSRGVRRRRPRWLPLAATIVVVAVCIAAGNWQRGRMHEKQALGAALAAADRQPPVPLPTGSDDWAAWRFRKVVASGRYDAATQFLLDNRVHDGVVGFDVVTPLALPDGLFVLVDRGFVPLHGDRSSLPDLPPPGGDVHVEGRVEMPPRAWLGSAQPSGVLWPRLEPALYAERTRRAVLPVYLAATGGDVGAGLTRDWPAPDVGTEKHIGYMLQWYTFAALAAGAWTVSAWRARRRAPERAA